jgi:hypothetical protein
MIWSQSCVSSPTPASLGSDDQRVVARRSRRATGESDPRARGDSEGPGRGSQHPASQRPPTTKEIRRQRATTPIFIQERAPPQGSTEAYQLNAGNRCADRPFPRSRPTVGAKGISSIDVQVCVHPVLRSTHAWLILAFGTTSYLILCTAVYLSSDHLSLAKSAAAAMPGRALVLREKEFGEAAQASERPRLDRPKRKVQVCGYL